ncbi:MAG: hypothetical protein QNJ70_11980 [Xenococcaceae cyanobacterium MO_207.B15]|nr:hypothetical protein [Xenococcaceae cyanobacterium MO_207.B15]MDJ0747781.1 hypothetical protein [Xenococcaceae cyanobacterium MO_167.B27]
MVEFKDDGAKKENSGAWFKNDAPEVGIKYKKVGKDVNIYHRLKRQKWIFSLIDKESGNEIKIMPTNYLKSGNHYKYSG